MKIITIDAANIDREHICCAIGNDKQNQYRAQTKKNWMKCEFDNGLVFKRLDQRGKVFIEYAPVETIWKPIQGKNYLVINCLWVSGQFKGKGFSTQLLDECIADARFQNKDGIAVVSSTKSKPFLTDKKFYLKHGFTPVDTAPPYFELLALKFNEDAETPQFSANAKAGMCAEKSGFTFIYSNQCPFMEEYVGRLAEIAHRKGIPCTVQKLKSYGEAQEIGSPFGTLGIYFNGEFQTHELMPETKFEKYLEEYTK